MRNRSMALVARGNSVLMVKQRMFGREFYTLPGGGIEVGETPEQAAERELCEECCIAGKVRRCLAMNYRGTGNLEYIFEMEIHESAQISTGADPEQPSDDQIIIEACWMRLDELSEKDRAFLWSYGLMEVGQFGRLVSDWGDEISYPGTNAR